VGLNHMHSRHVLHRDLKTANVFITAEQDAKIGDLGVSRLLSATHEMAHTIVGTPYYLSPELCEGRPYNVKSDVWAYGCIVYEMCSNGSPPFQASNQGALILKILSGQSQSVPSHVTRHLADLVESCLTKDPAQRPDTRQILGLTELQTHATSLGISLPAGLGTVIQIGSPRQDFGRVSSCPSEVESPPRPLRNNGTFFDEDIHQTPKQTPRDDSQLRAPGHKEAGGVDQQRPPARPSRAEGGLKHRRGRSDQAGMLGDGLDDQPEKPTSGVESPLGHSVLDGLVGERFNNRKKPVPGPAGKGAKNSRALMLATTPTATPKSLLGVALGGNIPQGTSPAGFWGMYGAQPSPCSRLVAEKFGPGGAGKLSLDDSGIGLKSPGAHLQGGEFLSSDEDEEGGEEGGKDKKPAPLLHQIRRVGSLNPQQPRRSIPAAVSDQDELDAFMRKDSAGARPPGRQQARRKYFPRTSSQGDIIVDPPPLGEADLEGARLEGARASLEIVGIGKDLVGDAGRRIMNNPAPQPPAARPGARGAPPRFPQRLQF